MKRVQIQNLRVFRFRIQASESVKPWSIPWCTIQASLVKSELLIWILGPAPKPWTGHRRRRSPEFVSISFKKCTLRYYNNTILKNKQMMPLSKEYDVQYDPNKLAYFCKTTRISVSFCMSLISDIYNLFFIHDITVIWKICVIIYGRDTCTLFTFIPRIP